MTYKKFKDKLEAAGIKDEDEIDYIDISSDGELVINAPENENEGWEIYS